MAAFDIGSWMVLEPIMKVEVSAPSEYQGDLVSMLTRRNGVLRSTDEIDNFYIAIGEVI